VSTTREKRQRFVANGGRESEVRAMLVSERVFALEDQRAAQACCYRWGGGASSAL
jgi:hypothetical protein